MLYLAIVLVLLCDIGWTSALDNATNDSPGPCTYTTWGWAQRATGQATASNTLCGSAWVLLLKSDAARLVVPENQLWLLAAQQYITASLNLQAIATTVNDTTIQEGLLVMGDSLTRVCGNVSQWSLQGGSPPGQLQDLLSLLLSFNHGQLGVPACSDEFVDVVPNMATFYYYNGDDVIAIRDPVTNQTQRNSLVSGLYNTQYGLYALGAVPVLLAAALACKLALHMDWRHKYTVNQRPASLSTVGGDDEPDEYELSGRTGATTLTINEGKSTDSTTTSYTSLQHEEMTFDEEIPL
jgi:hypothetical protein